MSSIPVRDGWCLDPHRDHIDPGKLFNDAPGSMVFCEAHRLPKCAICRVDFSMYNESLRHGASAALREIMEGYEPPRTARGSASNMGTGNVANRTGLTPSVLHVEASVPSVGIEGKATLYLVKLEWYSGGLLMKTQAVNKRYSQFLTLHEQLKKRHHQIAKFGFPSKYVKKIKPSKLRESRRAKFDEYVRLAFTIQPTPPELLEFVEESRESLSASLHEQQQRQAQHLSSAAEPLRGSELANDESDSEDDYEDDDDTADLDDVGGRMTLTEEDRTAVDFSVMDAPSMQTDAAKQDPAQTSSRRPVPVIQEEKKTEMAKEIPEQTESAVDTDSPPTPAEIIRRSNQSIDSTKAGRPLTPANKSKEVQSEPVNKTSPPPVQSEPVKKTSSPVKEMQPEPVKKMSSPPMQSEPTNKTSSPTKEMQSEPANKTSPPPVQSEPVKKTSPPPVQSEPVNKMSSPPMQSEPTNKTPSPTKEMQSEPSNKTSPPPVQSEPVKKTSPPPVQSEPVNKMSSPAKEVQQKTPSELVKVQQPVSSHVPSLGNHTKPSAATTNRAEVSTSTVSQRASAYESQQRPSMSQEYEEEEEDMDEDWRALSNKDDIITNRPASIGVLGSHFYSSGKSFRKGYVAYEVEVSYHDPSPGVTQSVWKRYSDFLSLHRALERDYAEVHRFAFPKKGLGSSKNMQESRIRKFSEFLNIVRSLEPMPPALGHWLGIRKPAPLAASPPPRASMTMRSSGAVRPSSSSINGAGPDPVRRSSQHPDQRQSVAPEPAAVNLDEYVRKEEVASMVEDRVRSVRAEAESKADEQRRLVNARDAEIMALRRAAKEKSEALEELATRQQYLESLGSLRVSVEDWERDGGDGHVRYLVAVRSEIPSAAAAANDDDDHDDAGSRSSGRTAKSTAVNAIDTLVRHRYRDFVELAEQLHTTIPLPPKFYLTPSNTQLEQRGKDLADFLQNILELYSVERVPLLREFLRLPEIPMPNPDLVRVASNRSSSYRHSTTDRNSLLHRISSSHTRTSFNGNVRTLSSDSASRFGYR